MQLELESITRTKDFLGEKWAGGSRWVGYPGIDQPLTTEHLLCFNTATEASTWCEPPLQQSGAAQTAQENRYFKPITDLLVRVEIFLQGQEPVTFPPEQIPDILQEHKASPLFRHEYDNLCLQLSTGDVAVANVTRQLIPVEHIEEYHLVSHHHRLHQDFQVGHSAKIIGSFTRYREGHQRLLQLAPQLTHDRAESIADLILVGQLRNCPLMLDIEGRPDRNSGITIATAYNYMGVLKLEANANLYLPQTMDRKLFVRLNGGARTLEYLDDRLEQADTKSSFQSICHYWFNNTPAQVVSARKVKERFFYNGKGNDGAHISR